MKKKKAFYKWLTSRYQLIIRKEETFAVQANVTLSRAKFILSIYLLLFLVFASVFFTFRLLGWGGISTSSLGPDAQARLVEFSVTLDSLSAELKARDSYVATIRKIAEGGEAFAIEANKKNEEEFVPVKKVEFKKDDLLDKDLRAEFESVGPGGKVSKKKPKEEMEVFLFYSPVSGIISSDFNAKIDHFAVDVVSKKDEPVKAIADGTVVLATWTKDTGYVIALQHDSDIISIYKHNSSLLKKAGNKVKGGETISIIGNTGELTTGPHLHFELWINGKPVNPKDYIKF